MASASRFRGAKHENASTARIVSALAHVRAHVNRIHRNSPLTVRPPDTIERRRERKSRREIERGRESPHTMPNSGHKIIHDKAIGAPARTTELINEAWNAIEKKNTPAHIQKEGTRSFSHEGLVVFREREWDIELCRIADVCV